MKRVVVIQEVLPQYRVPLFELLRSGVAEHDIELVLVHGQGTAAYRARRDGADVGWARPVRNRVIPLPGGAGATWQPAVRVARQADLVVVEHANRHLSNYVLLALQAARLGPRVAFWGHGANLQSRRRGGLREKWKAVTTRLPHWWFAYTAGSAQRVAAHGFPEERITVLQNAVDTSAYADVDVPRDPYATVYVGSLYEDKRIDFLLAAGELIAAAVPRFTLTVVGDGPQRDLVVAAAKRNPWLTYAGAAFGADKAATVSRASLMLIPGLVGLSVLDAFAGGAVVLTTSVPYQSPEFEYLESQRNAIVLAAHSTPRQYASAAVAALMNPPLLEELRRGCRATGQQITLPEMAKRFQCGLVAALQAPVGARRVD